MLRISTHANRRDGGFRVRRALARVRLRGLIVVLTTIAALALALPAGASALGDEVVAWGSDTDGQLGVGLPAVEEAPVHVCAIEGCSHGRLTGVSAISAGGERSVALLSTHGEVLAWGKNELGALGDGNVANSSSPVHVCAPELLANEGTSSNCPNGVLKGVTAISAGDGHNTIALLQSGEVVSWGTNASGDLGDGQEIGASPGANYSDVPVYVCAIETTPFKTCTTSTTERLQGAVAISAAPDHNAAIVGAGRELLTWGVNARGQLGQGFWTTYNDDPQHVCETEYPYNPVQGAPNEEPYCPAGHYFEGVEQITFGREHNIASFSGRYVIRTCNEGKLQEEEEEKKKKKGKGEEEHKGCCHSEGKDPAAGDEGEECCKEEAGREPEGCCKEKDPEEEECGQEFEKEASHSVVAFGNNEEGQLGDGLAVKPFFLPGQGGPAHCVKVGPKKTPCSSVPIHVCEPFATPSASPCGPGEYLEPVKAISSGGSHSMALEGNGEVLTWGESEVPSPVSQEAILGHKASSVCSFVGRPCSPTPETVVNEKNTGDLGGITAISGGTSHNLALTTGGEVFAWGDGREDRLGNHGTAPSLTPVKVCAVSGVSGCSPANPLKDVQAISAGSNHSLALVSCKLGIEPPPFHGGGGLTGQTGEVQFAERGLPYKYVIVPACSFTKPKWKLTEGSLPHGLELDAETGAISGTPAKDGTADFTVEVTNAEDEAASAELSLAVVSAPDVGTCVAAAAEPDGATFTDKGCTKRAEGATGRYEWVPGVARADFTVAAKGPIKLESVTKEIVTCAGASGNGTYSGAQEVADVTLTLSGCESRGLPCTSGELAAGEVETSALSGVLGRPDPKDTALDLAPGESALPFTSYDCGAVPVALTGSVIGSVKSGKMSTTTELKFSASKGRQKPEAFEGEGRDVLISRLGEGEPEQTGLTAKIVLTDEEALEVNAVT